MADSDKSKENDSIDYLGALLSWWWLVLFGTLGCGIVAAGVSLLLPNEYEASVMLVVAPPQFRTELKPGVFPPQTYKRILESKGLLSLVLAKMRENHAEDFEKVTVEDVLESCRTELEVTGRGKDETESPLLILSARHGNPLYAKEMADIWAKEFMELNEDLRKVRTVETDRFISKQFQETKAKLIEAEKAVTDFSDGAQMEALRQQIETISKQARQLLEQLEENREELVFAKGRQATLDERISALEIGGRWLGQLLEGEVDLSAMNTCQKGIASELLKVAEIYRQSTERLADLAETADVETLRKRLASYREMLVQKDPRLENIQAKRKSLEAALKVLSNQLSSTKQVIALKKSVSDEVLWEKLLDNPSKEDIEKLSKMHLTSEEINPEYALLAGQIIALKEELERAISEERHITAKIPQLEEEVKKFESMLRIQEKKKSDLMVYHSESKRAYRSRYADYIEWLDERNRCRISMAELERTVILLEGRHKERFRQMRSLNTDLNKKQDEEENLKRAVEVARHAYELLKNKVEESRITTAQETEDVRLVSSAVVPGKKVAPQRSLIATVAAIVGFLLLSLAVILFEYRAQMA